MKLLTIGVNTNSHIVLSSPYVSGYHAELLLLDNGEILLTDKGSKNGTYVNGHRIQPNNDVAIKRGDDIRFADKQLDWHSVPILRVDPRVKEIRGIGTNFRNKYQIQGESVSRFHATLSRMSDNKWYIQDHSKNGTTVNGKAIPSNQDVKLRRGDTIICAGVLVPNPCGDGMSFNLRKIAGIFAAVLMLCGVGYVVSTLIPDWEMSNSEIYKKYKSAVVQFHGAYYYKVTAGDYTYILENLEALDLFSTEYIFDQINGDILPRSGRYVNSMMHYTGTGFYISEDAKIATNLHIARPWLFDKSITAEIAKHCKIQLERLASTIGDDLRFMVSEIKVEGVLSYLGTVPNGAYLSGDNMTQCRELIGHDNRDIDVVVLQLDTQKIPSQCTFVNLEDAVIYDEDIPEGTDVFYLGFPFGTALQTSSLSKLQLFGQDGTITRVNEEYTFDFNAPAYHGASGSPIFNKRGQLVGILSSGVDISQGFNSAIKAAYLVDLLESKRTKIHK